MFSFFLVFLNIISTIFILITVIIVLLQCFSHIFFATFFYVYSVQDIKKKQFVANNVYIKVRTSLKFQILPKVKLNMVPPSVNYHSFPTIAVEFDSWDSWFTTNVNS